MITATYSTPANDWTRAIDKALQEWSSRVNGDANLNMQVTLDGPSNLLAYTAAGFVPVGTKADGTSVSVPKAAARFQGYTGGGPDIMMSVNPNWPWSFDGPRPGTYSFVDTAKHELGHGLYALGASGYSKTPYGLFTDGLPSGAMKDANHPTDPNSLMYSQANMNDDQTWDDFDLRSMSASGIPTSGDDTFYLIPGAKLTSHGGNDKAIWLDTYDKYNANLSGIKSLELQGANPFTKNQQDTYRLYRAAFGRTPDLAGFNFWNGDSRPFDQKAAAFGGSPEFINKNGPSQPRRDYISTLYQNILGRPPEQGGLDYWDGRKDLDTNALMANIALSDENKLGTPTFTL